MNYPKRVTQKHLVKISIKIYDTLPTFTEKSPDSQFTLKQSKNLKHRLYTYA